MSPWGGEAACSKSCSTPCPPKIHEGGQGGQLVSDLLHGGRDVPATDGAWANASMASTARATGFHLGGGLGSWSRASGKDAA